MKELGKQPVLETFWVIKNGIYDYYYWMKYLLSSQSFTNVYKDEGDPAKYAHYLICKRWRKKNLLPMKIENSTEQ